MESNVERTEETKEETVEEIRIKILKALSEMYILERI